MTHLVERAAALLRDGGPLRAVSSPAADQAEVAEQEAPRASAPAPSSARPPAPDGPPAADERPAPASGLELDMAALASAGLVVTGGRSRIAEEYRITVARALAALGGGRAGRSGPANLLMITSARPNEGKSFSALNIAASIAQNGLSDVLLVDLDSKPRSLSALLGLGEREGLVDLAVGEAAGQARPPEALIARTAIPGLSVLPFGLRRRGSEGTVNRAVSTALERLGRRFPRHVLVLDTAPCLSTSDPSALAAIADAVVLIVEAERTQRSELQASLELLKPAGNIALVLNKVRMQQRHAFGSYYYYYDTKPE